MMENCMKARAQVPRQGANLSSPWIGPGRPENHSLEAANQVESVDLSQIFLKLVQKSQRLPVFG
jgi:hypothetical protein